MFNWIIVFSVCLRADAAECEKYVFTFDKPKLTKEECEASGKGVMRDILPPADRLKYRIRGWGCEIDERRNVRIGA